MRLGVWTRTEIDRAREYAKVGDDAIRKTATFALLVNEERRLASKAPEPQPAKVIPITDRLRVVRGLLDQSKPPREPDE